jgi:hypothetical protein
MIKNSYTETIIECTINYFGLIITFGLSFLYAVYEEKYYCNPSPSVLGIRDYF